MAGTKAGGLAARETNIKKYGEDYYKKLGVMGGKAPYTGKKGFAANPDLARRVGVRGGRRSARLALERKHGLESA